LGDRLNEILAGFFPQIEIPDFGLHDPDDGFAEGVCGEEVTIFPGF
jgi:hypothetical protein